MLGSAARSSSPLHHERTHSLVPTNQDHIEGHPNTTNARRTTTGPASSNGPLCRVRLRGHPHIASVLAAEVRAGSPPPDRTRPGLAATEQPATRSAAATRAWAWATRDRWVSPVPRRAPEGRRVRRREPCALRGQMRKRRRSCRRHGAWNTTTKTRVRDLSGRALGSRRRALRAQAAALGFSIVDHASSGRPTVAASSVARASALGSAVSNPRPNNSNRSRRACRAGGGGSQSGR